MATKYFKSGTVTNPSIWFKLLDKSGKVIHDYAKAPCFSSLTYGGINKNTSRIQIYRNKSSTPYDVPAIKRWVDDLNELGFPCSFVDDGLISDGKKQEKFVTETVNKGMKKIALAVMRHGAPEPDDPNKFYNFFVDLKDYENKNHLFSTLSLLRCLAESHLCQIPDVYFQMMDTDPKMDKLEALQDAHKKIAQGGGHTVTYKGNGKNVSRKVLMQRLKKGNNLFASGYLSINQQWKG